MALYFIVYTYLLSFSALDPILKKDRIYTYMYAGFAVFIFFVAAFRGMGNDYEGYRAIFQSLQGRPFSHIFDASEVYVEPVFAVLNIIVGNFFPYQAVLAVMALANAGVLFPFFRKYSPYPYVSLLMFAGMFMYSGMMGLIRQSLAVAICMWAMASPRSKRFFWLVGLATMFHASALLVVFVRWLKNRFYSFKTYCVAIGIAVLSNLFFYGIFKLLIPLAPTVITWKLNTYIDSESGTHFGLNAAVILRLFTFFLAYFYRKRVAEAFPKYGPLFVNIYFLAVIFYIGFGFLPQMASRGAVYFHYMELLTVPMVLYVANFSNKIWIFILYATFSLMRHIDLVTVYREAYLPYKNILFN